MTDNASFRTRRAWAIAYGVLFAFFVFTRFYGITERPMHNDEGVNGFFTMNLLKSNNYKYDPTNYHGPTLYFFQVIPSWIFGLNVASTRSTIAFVSLLLLAALLLCRRLIGPWGTLVAILFVGISPNVLFYSRYYIHEIYVVLFTFGIYIGVARFVARPRPLWLYVAVASAALLFCTKETGVLHMGVLFLAGIGAWAIEHLLRADGIAAWKNENLEAWASEWQVAKSHLLWLALLAMVIWFLFFSSFFTNYRGLVDSFRAFSPWLKQGLKSGHEKPWPYFLTTLVGPYEFGLIIVAVLGACMAIIRNDRRGLFYLLWTLGTIAVYSAIPYKTPWCVVNFILPMALLGGFGVQSLIDASATIEERPVRWRVNACLGLLVLVALGGEWPVSWRLNYVEYDYEKHPQVYVHTSRDIFGLLKTVDETARKMGQGKDLTINFFTPEYWPLPFYLKDYPNAKFWGKIETMDSLDAPIVVGTSEQHAELRKRLKDPYSIATYSLRPGVYLDVWVNNRLMEKYELPLTVPDLTTSVSASGVVPGLREQSYSTIVPQGVPVRDRKVIPQFHILFDEQADRPAPPPFSIHWTGYLKIPVAGIYRFALDSDDGSKLTIDGTEVIDNLGSHAVIRKSRSVNFSAGLHKFDLIYYDIGGFAELGLYWRPPGGEETVVPSSAFFTSR